MFEVSTSLILKRGIGRGIRTLRRERRFKSALGALLGIFLLLQILVMVLLGLQALHTMLRTRTDVHVELQTTATDADVQAFYSALRELPYVESTTYITKEQAFEKAGKTNPELVSFLQEFNLANPFADTIDVTLASLDNYAAFSRFTEDAAWQNTVNPEFLSVITEQEKRVAELLRVTRAARAVTAVILAITALSLTLVTIEFVRSRALSRADEVLVERLTGATPLGILTPFATEAILLFWFAILLASLCVLVLLSILPLLIPALQYGGTLQEFRNAITPLFFTSFPWILAGEILLLPVVAILGVWLGIRPQIRSPRIAFSV